MAGGGSTNAPAGGKQYPGRMTPFVLMTCIVAATGGLTFGYDIGISGGVTSMDSFLVKFFPDVYRKVEADKSTNAYCKFESVSLTLFTLSLYLAALVASFFASVVTRKLGRKRSMFGGGITFLAGATINGAAQNVAMLIIGRILLGIGVGFVNQSVPVYLSEMAPARRRGMLNIGFQLMITIGILAANLINYGTAKIKGGWGWRVSLALAVVPAGIITIGSLFLPDTPNSLIERGFENKARLMLRKIRGTPDINEEYTQGRLRCWGCPSQLAPPSPPLVIARTSPGVSLAPHHGASSGVAPMMGGCPSQWSCQAYPWTGPEYADLVVASEESKAVEHPWKIIVQRKYRAQLTMSILIPIFQQLAGINVIMFYAPVFFKTIGFGDDASLMSAVITGLVNVFATLVSVFTVDEAGRRKLFLEGGIQMLACQIVVGTLIAIKFGTNGEAHLSKAYAFCVVLFICIYVAGFAWSWGPLGWLVPSEIFPLEIRSAGQSISVSVNMLFTFIIAQAFLAMLCKMKFWLFYFFGGWVVIMTTFIGLFLPETKNVPIEEMVWKSHWFWGRFISDEDVHVG